MDNTELYIRVLFKEKSEPDVYTKLDRYTLDNDFLTIINGDMTIILMTFDIKRIEIKKDHI